MFSQTIRLVSSQEKRKGLSLSYDDNTELLCVGSNIWKQDFSQKRYVDSTLSSDAKVNLYQYSSTYQNSLSKDGDSIWLVPLTSTGNNKKLKIYLIAETKPDFHWLRK